MAKLAFFKLGSSWLGGLRTIGRALKMRVSTQPYIDMTVETKAYIDMAVEAKSYIPMTVETREVEP